MELPLPTFPQQVPILAPNPGAISASHDLAREEALTMAPRITESQMVHVRAVCNLITSNEPDSTQALVDLFNDVQERHRSAHEAGLSVGLECLRRLLAVNDGVPFDLEALVDLMPAELFPNRDVARAELLAALFGANEPGSAVV